MKYINIIPLAGQGKRYQDAGYVTPKPLIEIDGIPMVVKAAQSLPKADKWIFICQEDHINKFSLDKILLNYFPEAVIISINYLTEGQAITCLLAKEYIDPNDKITIGPCDSAMEFDKKKFFSLLHKNDALIWTFKNNPCVLEDPKMYGWVNINKKNIPTRISCKTPISNNPIQDNAIVGAFSFNKAQLFFDYTERLLKNKSKIRGEYYIDSVLDNIISKNYQISLFKINKYIGWGTPTDLRLYKENNN